MTCDDALMTNNNEINKTIFYMLQRQKQSSIRVDDALRVLHVNKWNLPASNKNLTRLANQFLDAKNKQKSRVL